MNSTPIKAHFLFEGLAGVFGAVAFRLRSACSVLFYCDQLPYLLLF